MHGTDLRRFDLNLLVIFDALMRERHVGRAGERIGLTQPAVSHALGRLRHLLDDPLFVKNAKGVRPTPRAEELADAIAPALQMLRTGLNQREVFDPSKVARTIVVGASDYITLASHAEGFHLRVLLKPCGNLSIHTASDVRLPTLKNRQWEKSFGLARRTRTNHSLAPFGRPRRRLNFQRAQRIR